MDTETVIFSTGVTCRVAERMCTEGIVVADDVVGAGVFAFLGALAFLGAGPAELGAEEGVGAAVERESLDSSSSLEHPGVRPFARWFQQDCRQSK